MDSTNQDKNKGGDSPENAFPVYPNFIEYIRYSPELGVYKKYSQYRIYIEAFFQLIINAGLPNITHFPPDGSVESSEPYDINVDMVLQLYLIGVDPKDFEGKLYSMDPLMFRTWYKNKREVLRKTAQALPIYNQILNVIENSIEVINKEGLAGAQMVGDKIRSKDGGRHTTGKNVEQDQS